MLTKRSTVFRVARNDRVFARCNRVKFSNRSDAVYISSIFRTIGGIEVVQKQDCCNNRIKRIVQNMDCCNNRSKRTLLFIDMGICAAVEHVFWYDMCPFTVFVDVKWQDCCKYNGLAALH